VRTHTGIRKNTKRTRVRAQSQGERAKERAYECVRDIDGQRERHTERERERERETQTERQRNREREREKHE